MIGKTLSHYRIVGEIAAGGMGVVYRAEDTSLGREVALKLLHGNAQLDPAARERLVREARTASQLSHPNICTIHEVGEADGQLFIAMELVEGRPLNTLLASGGLPIESVIRYGVQIADGLASAHKLRVVHRDLKSANVVITSDGRAKILDFGLAKQVRDDGAGGARASSDLTGTGIVVGTPQYLAPEVLLGAAADVRGDLWALGVLLYEMATGTLPFSGQTSAGLIYSIVNAPPTPLPARVPAGLRAVVTHCLQKEPGQRFQSAAEVRAALEALEHELPAQAPAPPAKSRFPGWALWAAAVAAILALVAGGVWLFWRKPPPSGPLQQRQITSAVSEGGAASFGTISPDGKYFALASPAGIQVRAIDSGDSRTMPLPDGFTPAGPFIGICWYPDGSHLLLSGGTMEGKPSLWSIPVVGGITRKIRADAGLATMSPDGSLIAYLRESTVGTEVWIMSATGESPRMLVPADSGRVILAWPVWAPGGRRLAYSLVDAIGSDPTRIETCDLEGHRRVAFTDDPRQYLHSFAAVTWLRDGRLLFGLSDPPPGQRDMNLWSLRVDPRSGAPSGPPQRISQWVRQALVMPAAASADGKRLSVGMLEYQSDCYVARIAGGDSALQDVRRVTQNDRMDLAPTWTPDGKALLFCSDRNGSVDIFRQSLLAQDAEPLITDAGDQISPRSTPDGAWIMYRDGTASRQAATTRLMRVPTGGGPAEKVMDLEEPSVIRTSSAAGSQCVISEPEGPGMVFSTLDPLKGRGRRLARVELPAISLWDLSPDGSRVAVVDSRDSIPRIEVVPLAGGPGREVRLDRIFQVSSITWAGDGQSWFVVGSNQGSEWTVFRVRGNGRTTNVLPRQFWMYSAAVSPDGRHIVYTSNTGQGTTWLLENF